MKYYFRFLIVPLLLGTVSFLLYAARLPEVPATTVLLNTAFQNTHLMPDDIPEILTRFLPLLLFQIFYGTMIYRHFCTASIYYFSRKTKRVPWRIPRSSWSRGSGSSPLSENSAGIPASCRLWSIIS